MKCEKCGAELFKNATYCHKCGHMLAKKIQHMELKHESQKKCRNCGMILPNDAKFCFSCGSKCGGSTSRRMICEQCGGIMSVDETRNIMFCQYCGSQNLVEEGDNVTIQRIKSHTEKEVELSKQQTYKEIEMQRLDQNAEKDILGIWIDIVFLVILSILSIGFLIYEGMHKELYPIDFLFIVIIFGVLIIPKKKKKRNSWISLVKYGLVLLMLLVIFK